MDTDAGQTPAGPRRYRIWVVGRLDERFIDGLEGIELGASAGGSTLEGPFVDQSQLRGVLDRLWQLGIEVSKFDTYLPGTEETRSETSLPIQAAERHPDQPRAKERQ